MNSLILRREGPTALLILNRPPINALDREALEELGLAVEEIRLIGKPGSGHHRRHRGNFLLLVVTLSTGVRFKNENEAGKDRQKGLCSDRTATQANHRRHQWSGDRRRPGPGAFLRFGDLHRRWPRSVCPKWRMDLSLAGGSSGASSLRGEDSCVRVSSDRSKGGRLPGVHDGLLNEVVPADSLMDEALKRSGRMGRSLSRRFAGREVRPSGRGREGLF